VYVGRVEAMEAVFTRLGAAAPATPHD
jgi:hypothetical protein